jgi:hypothetical protein
MESLTGQPYAYANDSPLIYEDPTGQCSALCWGGIVLGGISFVTGAGEVVAGAAAVADAADAASGLVTGVGAISDTAGGAATVIDTEQCVSGKGLSSPSCVGAVAGAIGAGGGLAGLEGLGDAGQAVADSEALGGSFTAFLWDLQAALNEQKGAAPACVLSPTPPPGTLP